MKEKQQTRSRLLEVYGKLNRLTLAGFLGFATLAAFVAPHLVIPALSLAVIDAGQVLVIDRVNKKKEVSGARAVFEGQKPRGNVIFLADYIKNRRAQAQMAA